MTWSRPIGRPPRRGLHALLALAVGLAACDFGGGGGEGGCARVHQGAYSLPVKRIVRQALALRLTQRGVDFVTERIRALVLAFFEVDPATGRAVISLSSLGVGDLSTGLGPLDAEVRDLVLTVDLSELEVRFVPGSSPPRLQIRVEDAVIGLRSGALAGTVDALLFSGDAACALSDGPGGHVARLDLTVELELATAPNGGLAVRVLPAQTIDVHDVGVAVDLDCDLPECLDGDSPGSTAECFECETICPAVDVASALVTLVQGALDDLVDGLLELLADDVANLFLDGFLNGRPLAVEGTVDLAGLFGPILPWLDTARPLGLLVRPAGAAFRLTGSGDALGLELVMDAGADAAPAHPCVGAPGADPVFEASQRPHFDGVVALPDGAPAAYDLALAVSGALVDEAVWALYASSTCSCPG